MVTRDNLIDVIKMIDAKDEKRMRNSDKEFVCLDLHVFNTGSVLHIMLTNIPEKNMTVKKALQSGGAVIYLEEVLEIIDSLQDE